MPPVELTWGAATALGQREDNQDRFLATPPVFAVADGMGGHVGGAAAAEAVVEALGALAGREMTTVDDIRLALRRADAKIRDFRGPDRAGAGTTVAGVALVDEGDGPQWAVFHVGDSRVYRWHEGQLEQLTKDHSVVQELVDAGYISDESASTHPQRHIITRALGVGPRPEADIVLLPVVPGEDFLACTDGLTGELADEQIAALLGTDTTMADVTIRLTAEASRLDARDNVTVVGVHCIPGELHS
ncbi:protein phosphatase 2C domain-containing protein [Geodermatophilus sp. DSM 44513]|uniref:PP2C family protein-serine/threonine phosphatase n=1 Tax=Geodermatophilus sp. DSM 44513 TaxID=1528104 RepID=UPI00127C5924|nr:protein phosphatase 2C domain-containing protein [Geodermatophilus sp. DSM 44513]WNV76003.1 protein phosphatase 2C domain-containing protein [Geodermatophilus sp. DSM 44513]